MADWQAMNARTYRGWGHLPKRSPSCKSGRPLPLRRGRQELYCLARAKPHHDLGEINRDRVFPDIVDTGWAGLARPGPCAGGGHPRTIRTPRKACACPRPRDSRGADGFPLGTASLPCPALPGTPGRSKRHVRLSGARRRHHGERRAGACAHPAVPLRPRRTTGRPPAPSTPLLPPTRWGRAFSRSPNWTGNARILNREA